jgi:hypothetical protein
MPDPSGHEERGSNWNPNEQDYYRKFFSHRIEIANQEAVGCSVLLDAFDLNVLSSAFVSRLLPQRSTATSRLHRP